MGNGECDKSGRRRGAKRATARVARAMVTAIRWEVRGGHVTKGGVEGDGDGEKDGYGDGKKGTCRGQEI